MFAAGPLAVHRDDPLIAMPQPSIQAPHVCMPPGLIRCTAFLILVMFPVHCNGGPQWLTQRTWSGWDFNAQLADAMFPSMDVQAKFQTSYDRRMRNSEYNHFLGLQV